MVKYLLNIGCKLCVLICALLVSTGCVRDKLDICDLYLRFSYTYNMENKELFQEEVEQVTVFFYDKDDKFAGMIEEKNRNLLSDPNYRMKIPFEYTEGNNYKAVVWAGKIEGSYMITSPRIGDDISSLQLQLIAASKRSSAKIAQLWHGMVSDLSIDEGTKVVTVDLVRTTNNIRFSINGEPVEQSYSIRVISDNGKYNHTHGIIPDGDITYLPHSVIREGNIFTTMRFLLSHPLKIEVYDNINNNAVTINGSQFLDIISYVLETRPMNMENQEYLDREYNWVIDLAVDTINAMAVNITINGWTVWFNNTGF